MLGIQTPQIFGQIKNQLGALARGSYRDALANVIPGYNIIEQQLIPFLEARTAKNRGKRKDSTVVDRGEIETSFRNISRLLGGTVNPISIVFNFVRGLLGKNKEQRAQDELNILKEYSGLYDNYLYANETITFLKKKLFQQISKKEGIISKAGLAKNKDINKDPVIMSIKDTLREWATTPYRQILSGGVSEASGKQVRLYQNDIEFLRQLVSDLRYGGHSKYTQDLASDVEAISKQMESNLVRQAATQSAPSQGTNRDIAQQLAA